MNINENFIIPGFIATGIASGIKKDDVSDLGLIFSEFPAITLGLYTTNKIKAAPIILNMERQGGSLSQAIIVNSGNANACTGKAGIEDAKRIISQLESTCLEILEHCCILLKKVMLTILERFLMLLITLAKLVGRTSSICFA